jgi:flavocytochrome c
MIDLVSDGTGQVCGVKILSGYNFSKHHSKSQKNLRAKKAVVLATGGFGSDVKFRMLQNPVLDASMGSTNHKGATGEGLVAALRLGAAPVHLSWIQLGPWGCADEKGYGKGGRFASYSVYPCGILVDPASGRRIVNEWGDRKQRSDAILRSGHPCLGIVDSKGVLKDPESLETCLRQGKVKKFVSLKELATAYGVDFMELEKTVCHYNRTVKEKGIDEFGKPLGKSATPLNRPPLYAISLWPKVHYTLGGVGIDAHARVVDTKGGVIAGLFAAGEVCGGIHGADRLGGSSLTECIVFGRIAGRSAVGDRS